MSDSVPKKYLRPSEVERVYGIKVGILYALLTSGKVRSARVGGKAGGTRGTRLVDVQSLEAFIASRATGGSQ